MNAFNRGVIARLKPGISHQEAHANLDAIAQRIGKGMRATIPGGVDIDLRTKIVPIREVFSRDVRHGLVMLMGAVGLLLVIACVNLANLLLARLSSRSRELATRAAVGASRGRLIRQLLTESVVLATLGGAAGLPVAIWGTALLLSLGPADFSTAESMPLDPPVFLFAMSVVLGVGLAVGLIPALSMGRGNLHGTLTEGGRGMSTGRRTGQLRRALVTAEVALCAFLLVVAGLLVRSFVNLLDVNSGIRGGASAVRRSRVIGRAIHGQSDRRLLSGPARHPAGTAWRHLCGSRQYPAADLPGRRQRHTDLPGKRH